MKLFILLFLTFMMSGEEVNIKPTLTLEQAQKQIQELELQLQQLQYSSRFDMSVCNAALGAARQFVNPSLQQQQQPTFNKRIENKDATSNK